MSRIDVFQDITQDLSASEFLKNVLGAKLGIFVPVTDFLPPKKYSVEEVYSCRIKQKGNDLDEYILFFDSETWETRFLIINKGI